MKLLKKSPKLFQVGADNIFNNANGKEIKMNQLSEKISKMAKREKIRVEATDSNLINAWAIACKGLKYGIELVLGSENGKLIIIRER